MKGKCVFCGEIKELVNLDGMCKKCEKELKEEYEAQKQEDIDTYNSIVH